MLVNRPSEKRRRGNDALRSAAADTPFQRELKVIAKAKGLTATSLAKLCNVEPSTVIRSLLRPGRKTQKAAAEYYAGSLGVGKAYFRLLTLGYLESRDLPQAFQHWSTLIDEARAYLSAGSADEILATIDRLSYESQLDLLYDVYIDGLKHAEHITCALKFSRPPALATLRVLLKKYKIDIARWTSPMSSNILAIVFVQLNGVLSDEHRDFVIGATRARLKKDKQYQPVMDEHLESARVPKLVKQILSAVKEKTHE